MSLLTLLRRSAPALADTLATLPDPTLTRNERAWTTLWYIESHRREWDQGVFGRFTDTSRRNTVGCFAHHLVKTAGYVTFGCYVADALDARPRTPSGLFYHDMCSNRPCLHADWVKTEEGWETVSTVASRLLGVNPREEDRMTQHLFAGGNSIATLRRGLPQLVGAEPRCRH